MTRLGDPIDKGNFDAFGFAIRYCPKCGLGLIGVNDPTPDGANKSVAEHVDRVHPPLSWQLVWEDDGDVTFMVSKSKSDVTYSVCYMPHTGKFVADGWHQEVTCVFGPERVDGMEQAFRAAQLHDDQFTGV